MNSTRSVLVLLTLLVLGTAIWSISKVLRIQPLAPAGPTATNEWERVPEDPDEDTSSALADPDSELAEPDELDESRAAAAVEDAEEPTDTEIVAHSGPASVLRGLLIDEDTREPLPHYLLKLNDEAGSRIDVTTDAEGRFVTPAALAHGTIDIRPLDHPKRRARPAPIVRTHPGADGAEFQIATASGPTYRLAIVPDTVPVAALEARLRVDGNVRGSQEYDPVREGTPPWVRFPPVSGDRIEARGLEVRDRDGMWTGRAEVSRVRGVSRDIVRVVLEPRARLSGRVVDARGQPLASVRVTMKAVAGEMVGQERTIDTKADGAWRFDHLPAGTVSLSAAAFRYEPQKDLRVALVVGETIDQTITLNQLPPAGSIRGRVTSESGRYEMPSRAVLTLVDNTDGMAPQHVQLVWSDSGSQRVATFEFRDLPAGKYRVAGRTDGAWYELSPEWKPAFVFASPPDASLSFVVLDNTARADLVLRVTDVDTGQPVQNVRSWFAIGDKPGRSRDLDSGETAIRGLPFDQKLRWRIDKNGFQPVIGDAASFGLETRTEGRVQRIADVAFVRGWGELFRVSDADGKKPLAGARILLDGREAGVTDAEGLALVRANERPQDIRVEYNDWSMRGRVDRSPATRRKNQYHCAIAMSPPRKKR